MATTALPSAARHSGARALSGIRRRAAAAVARVLTPHKAALGNLAHMPLTVIGAGCIDFAAFHLAHGWGWLVTGLSLVVIELAIADEQ